MIWRVIKELFYVEDNGRKVFVGYLLFLEVFGNDIILVVYRCY